MAKTIEKTVKDKFDYDISALAPYIDEQNPEILSELTEGSLFLGRLNQMTGVKGSEKIKLLSDSVSLQAADSCGWSASGGIIVTDKTISNVRIKVQEEYCNETLNGAWTQMRNRIGANIQDMENPFPDVIIADKVRLTQKAMENLAILGDTASLDPNLAFTDGLVKLWDADADLNTVTVATPITVSNAYTELKKVARAIPTVLRSNGVLTEIICGQEVADFCIDQIWNDKDYNATIETSRNEAGEMSFVLPGTDVTVRVQPQLNGTEKIYAVPYSYVSYATDGNADEEGFEVKYNDTDEKLRVGVKFRFGIDYVFSEYFTKAVNA